MQRSEDFLRASRRGVRAGRSTLVVHAGPSRTAESVRVGFVVSKAVGNAVTRNRVKRRLRHLAADRLPVTPAGVDLVVRALPRAATNPAELPVDFASAWAQALRKVAERTAGGGRR
ncbi:MAG: rnpA [Friedmanniella sp.]|nr:rnpA [Friedmanniella sp.]